jgi:two-component system nitrogen regulation sensor histidine kinase NtrY
MTTIDQNSPAYRLMRRAVDIGIGPVGTVILAAAAVFAGGATYVAVYGLAPELLTRNDLPKLLLADIAIVLILSCLIAFRLVSILIARRRGKAGARLYVRMVLLFSLMAVLPTVVISTFIGYTVNTTLQDLFNNRVKSSLEDALAVSEVYIEERQQAIQGSVSRFVDFLQANIDGLVLNQQQLTATLSRFLASSGFSEVAIVDQFGTPIARGQGQWASSEYIRPEQSEIQTLLQQSQQNPKGGAALAKFFFIKDRNDRINFLVLISPGQNLFLYVSQYVSPTLLDQVRRVQQTTTAFTDLEGQRSENLLRLAMILVIIVLVMLLLAVWIGILFATRLSEPISALIGAAERVRGGDLAVRVAEPRTEDELGVLSRAFNRMTGQLGEQRQELIAANNQLDERSRFTEAVLAGVSSAVISLSADGEVELANRAAYELFGVDPGDGLGFRLADRVPGMGGLLELSRARPSRIAQQELEFRRNGETRTLLTRVMAEQFKPGEGGRSRLQGFVVTFDDVTDLLSAQRKAAWADVARRIAHEIKNPLTPIQLSAERLKRKYLKQIVDDPETFAVCTDTIIRQVGDIGRMVDEFSSFARMPRPVLQNEDVKEICLQALFLQRNAQPQIAFSSKLPDHPVELPIDRRQIGQALTNLLKNAGEAIEGRTHGDGQALPPGEIMLRMEQSDDKVAIIVEDNGKGLPQAERSRLTEPYVTTRAKGTGLGLAIVKKIMEDHGGYLLLEDRDGGGARVSLVFMRSQAATSSPNQMASGQPQSSSLKSAHGA